MNSCTRTSSHDGTKPRPLVILADDDLVCLNQLAQAFQALDFDTCCCVDGLEAWAVIQQRKGVVMAVLNWMMPNLDGHEICRRLHDRHSNIIPVLMVGKCFLKESWTRLYLQARYVITKPFPLSGIDREVSHLARLVLPESRAAGQYTNEPFPDDSYIYLNPLYNISRGGLS